MCDYFVRTDVASVGPFSDVELRELAFAGLLKPDSKIATSPNEHWISAQSMELFSFQKMPVPHPEGTVVPHFEVQGLPPAFRGPFKLRELFGFASRGMLSPDALIKGDKEEEWRLVQQFPALMFCLNGDLVKLGVDRQLVLRTTGNPEKVNLDNTLAPIELAKQAALLRPSSVEPTSLSTAIVDEGYEAERAAIQAANANAKTSSGTHSIANAKNATRAETNDSAQTISSRPKLDYLRELLKREIAWSDLVQPSRWSRSGFISMVASMCLIAVAVIYAFTKKPPNPNDRILGIWYGESSHPLPETSNIYGISFKEDGQCIIFESEGNSWQGAYSFSERHGQDSLYDSLMPLDSVMSTVESSHQAQTVQPDDGYIRFISTDGTTPKIDGRPIEEAFVRFGRDELQLGYVTTIHWTVESKAIEAGWIALRREQIRNH